MRVQNINANNYQNYQKKPEFGSIKAIIPQKLQSSEGFLKTFSLVNWVDSMFKINHKLVNRLKRARNEHGIDVFLNPNKLTELFELHNEFMKTGMNTEEYVQAYKKLTQRIIQIYHKPDMKLEYPIELLSDLKNKVVDDNWEKSFSKWRL